MPRVPSQRGLAEHRKESIVKLKPNQRILALYFKEIAQDTLEEDAEKLVRAYRQKMTLTVQFAESPQGPLVHSAFGCRSRASDGCDAGWYNPSLIE
jgi:hypothetical protein